MEVHHRRVDEGLVTWRMTKLRLVSASHVQRSQQRSQSWVIVPRTALKTSRQVYRSFRAAVPFVQCSAGQASKNVRFGQRPASGVQSEQVKGGSACAGQPNIKRWRKNRPRVVIRAASTAPPSAAANDGGVRLRGDDEDGFDIASTHPKGPKERPHGRHAQDCVRVLNTLRDVAMLLQKGSRFMIEDEEDGMEICTATCEEPSAPLSVWGI